MTWEDIRTQYAGQWVLIRYHQLDEHLNVLAGEVVAHLHEQEDLYCQLLQTPGQNIALSMPKSSPRTSR